LRGLNKLLIPFIDRYFDKYRPLLLRPDSPQSALWLSSRHGTRLTEKYIAHLIRAKTLSTVGVKVTPHLFRTSTASAAALHCGENPYLGSSILHHTDPRVTNDHYNRATSLIAAESFRQIVRQYEKT
jgi:site-specific recombinase XerD